jgi:hypothetical protein
VKHAGASALNRIEPLLREIRNMSGFTEKRRGVFYLKSRAALHFHEDAAGLFADPRLPGDTDFERLKIDQLSDQRTPLARLRQKY